MCHKILLWIDIKAIANETQERRIISMKIIFHAKLLVSVGGSEGVAGNDMVMLLQISHLASDWQRVITWPGWRCRREWHGWCCYKSVRECLEWGYPPPILVNFAVTYLQSEQGEHSAEFCSFDMDPTYRIRQLNQLKNSYSYSYSKPSEIRFITNHQIQHQMSEVIWVSSQLSFDQNTEAIFYSKCLFFDL